MISILLSGKLHGDPVTRASKAGKPFTSVKLIAAQADGESVWCSLVCFTEDTQRAMAALSGGDSACVAGTAKLTAFVSKAGDPRPQLDVVVDQVLTAYAVQKRRTAAAPAKPVQHEHDDWLDGDAA